MSNQKSLKYVEAVMARIVAPEELKARLRAELNSYITEASEHASMDEIMDELGYPEELAEELSHKLVNGMNKELDRIFTEADEQDVVSARTPERHYKKPVPIRDCHKHKPIKYRGEYSREESNVNIKLLYIPLIQISSGVEKKHLSWTEEDYDCD
ncbi:MAG: hypothetical protein ACOYVK_09055 [Bacillota bacterium]